MRSMGFDDFLALTQGLQPIMRRPATSTTSEETSTPSGPQDPPEPPAGGVLARRRTTRKATCQNDQLLIDHTKANRALSATTQQLLTLKLTMTKNLSSKVLHNELKEKHREADKLKRNLAQQCALGGEADMKQVSKNLRLYSKFTEKAKEVMAMTKAIVPNMAPKQRNTRE